MARGTLKRLITRGVKLSCSGHQKAQNRVFEACIPNKSADIAAFLAFREGDLIVNTNNDLTLKEHCELWKENMDQKISIACMFKSFKRARITLKKSQSNPVNEMR